MSLFESYPDDVDVEIDIWRRNVKNGQSYRFVVILADGGRDPDVEFLSKKAAWPGVDPEEWAGFQEAVRASPPYDMKAVEREWKLCDPEGYARCAASVHPVRRQVPPAAGVRLPQTKEGNPGQQLLRQALKAASPNEGPAPIEAVRTEFMKAHPQGKGAAARKAWSRALRHPPPGIAIGAENISAL